MIFFEWIGKAVLLAIGFVLVAMANALWTRNEPYDATLSTAVLIASFALYAYIFIQVFFS